MITKGQRLLLSSVCDSTAFNISIQIKLDNAAIDYSCFGLDAHGKLSDDRYMIFFNQTRSPCGGVRLDNNSNADFTLAFDLEKIPASIERLAITAAIDGNGSMGQMASGLAYIHKSQAPLAEFKFSGSDFLQEKAVILLELYRKNGSWRLGATAQGFNGGLADLVAHFGGAISDASTKTTELPPPLAKPSKAPPQLNKPAKAPAQRNKITLQKPGDSNGITLTKKGITRITVTMEWTKAVDLDLHAFYKTKDGKFGHVSFVNRGAQDNFPYIQLNRDSGVGNSAGKNQEIITIGSLDQFSSILICVNIFRFLGFSNKGDNFALYDGKIILSSDTNPTIEVPLTSTDMGRWCIIAKIDNSNGNPQIININRVQKDEPNDQSF